MKKYTKPREEIKDQVISLLQIPSPRRFGWHLKYVLVVNLSWFIKVCTREHKFCERENKGDDWLRHDSSERQQVR